MLSLRRRPTGASLSEPFPFVCCQAYKQKVSIKQTCAARYSDYVDSCHRCPASGSRSARVLTARCGSQSTKWLP
ncbi:protein of unknown function [Agreia sp. COWG]|nr:protein of unknown function [Agreia sp. COWG]